MRLCTKNTCGLKVRRYPAILIYLNEYLASFPGATMADKIGITKIDGILLNSMPNIWCKQAYIQGLDWESISFKKSTNMFERMEIPEIIYEGVVTPSYKKISGRIQI